MSIKYPQEILDQQLKVRQELEKLARMRTDYLKSTGQMPPSGSRTESVKKAESRSGAAPDSGRSDVIVT